MVVVASLIPQLFHTRGSLRAVRNLLEPLGGDRGEPDPGLRRAVAGATTSRTGYLDAIVALCTARLFMAVMSPQAPAPRDAEVPGVAAPQVNELGAVLLTHRDGTRALLCFSGMDAMVAWDSRARPVPGTLDDLAATVTEAGADVLLLDVAGPVPMVIGKDLVDQLSQGRRLVRMADGGYGWMSTAP